MKKLVFAMMAVFAMVSCGGGGAMEDAVAIEKEFTEKLAAAVEEKNSEAAVEAWKWYYEEQKALNEDYKEFKKEAKDVAEENFKVEAKLADADWLKASDKEAIRNIKKDMKNLD